MNLTMKQKQTQRTDMLAKGEGVRGGVEWEVRVSRYKLLYMEWINNKVLLYSTENYVQYPLINRMEKNIFKNILIICPHGLLLLLYV